MKHAKERPPTPASTTPAWSTPGDMIPRLDQLAFNFETAFKLGCHCNLAYHFDVIDAAAILATWGFYDTSFIDGRALFKDNDTQVYVASSSTAIVIAFRGSEANLDDWIETNAQMIRKPLPWLPPGVTTGEAHSGFVDALCAVPPGGAESILDLVVAALDAFQPRDGPRKHVFLTGHSLGGALATLMAMYLRGILFRPRIQPHVDGQDGGVQVMNERRAVALTVYTLGSPRLFDDVLALAYDHELRDKTFRVVHERDVVTQVPPYRWGYTHVGTSVYVGSDGTVDLDQGPAERALGDGVQLSIPLLFGVTRTLMSHVGGILDHSLGTGPLTNNGPLPGWIRFFIHNGGYLGALGKGLARLAGTGVPRTGLFGLGIESDSVMCA